MYLLRVVRSFSSAVGESVRTQSTTNQIRNKAKQAQTVANKLVQELQQGPTSAKHAATSGMPPGTLPEHHEPSTSFFGAGKFTNPWSTWEEKKFTDVMRWHKERKKLGVNMEGHLEGIPNPTASDFARAFPLNLVNWKALANPPPLGIQALWVGHATVLVQMGGLTFITDPVMSERCSPVQWAGPKRVVPAALQGTEPELQALDFVLISHNHYDHLDTNTVAKLNQRWGKALTWYVPLGVKPWFDSAGIKGKQVVELDWWQEVEHVSPSGRKARITMTPAQHWSARGVLDRRATLWGGYAVKSLPLSEKEQPLNFWFTGDTGYCSVFKEVGAKLGPFDLSAIPIGAYEPRWFMKPQHVNAEEGLQVHRDVRSRRSIAIHTATWSLTDEPLDEPPRRLAEALAVTGGDPHEFITLQHGELIVVQDGQTVNTPKRLGPSPEEAALAVKASKLDASTNKSVEQIKAVGDV